MAPKAAAKKKDNTVLENLHDSVTNIFEQAQSSLANHKKNCVALYKIHTRAAEVTEPAKDGVKLTGEKAFQDVFIDMVNRVLMVKKGPANADRVVKYVGAFVRFMNEKALEPKANGEDEEDEENPTTRFVFRLLTHLLQGFVAKNKIVRYRCIHVVSEMISHLGEIDEDAYTELRNSLIERLNDKETIIRAHAVIALSKLAGSEDPEDVKHSEGTILQTLLETISTDPAAEVRRSALLNVPVSPTTIDAILSRTRDVDPVTRKLVYSGVLQTKLEHPRHLTISQREQIVKDGLGDREPAVRLAASKLVTAWYELTLSEAQNLDNLGWVGDDGGVMKGFVNFLCLFDVVGPGEAVAVDAVVSIFTTRPDLPDVFSFSDEYWKQLTAESVVLARVFLDQCTSTKNDARLESASLPVVTAFAFHVQEAYNNLLRILQEIETAKLLRPSGEAADNDEDDNEELEEELAKAEVVMGELLRMVLSLDYADEIGRRKVFSVVRDMLAHPQLPPGLIDRCLDVLKEIMPSERDLIRLIVEIVIELREGEEDAENADEPPLDDDQSDVSQATIKKDKLLRRIKGRQEMSPEERIKADMTDIRCLMLCISMLERVNGTFEDNSTLEGILADLIIPSVKRKELAMREKALVSLGLCCLIAKNMALSSFQLFLSQAQNAPPELKIQVLRVIMDLLIMYDQDFFGRSEDTARQIVDFLLQILEAEESAEAQAVLVTGLSKLLLAGIITESKVLSCLAIMYISPTTTNNQEIRQCLSYFFPVYSYSSPLNQSRTQSIFISTFDLATTLYENLDDDQEMVTPHQFGMLMVDWTNPLKAAEIVIEGDEKKPQNTHVELAVEILVALYDFDRSVDQQKVLCQILGQLYIEHGLEDRSIQKLNILLSNHEEICPFDNSVNERIFDKFKNKIFSIFEKELKFINPRQFVDDEFRDIYQRIGADAPGDDDEGGSKERRSRAFGKRKVKEEEVDEEEEEDEDEAGEEEEEEEGNGGHSEMENSSEAADQPAKASTPPPKRARQVPTRKSARQSKAPAKSPKKAPVEDSDSQDSDEENIPPPVLPSSTATPKKKGVKRIYTPGSGNLNSPGVRKRTRVKASLKPSLKESTPTNTDIETPITPTKPTRQLRGRKAKEEMVSMKDAISEKIDDDNLDDVDANKVAGSLSFSFSSPLTPLGQVLAAASSDEFGGYSD